MNKEMYRAFEKFAIWMAKLDKEPTMTELNDFYHDSQLDCKWDEFMMMAHQAINDLKETDYFELNNK